jgi:YD repeat-containing protein
MPTITLARVGQISDPIEVGPGTRVTATGGYVEWTTGTLADVRNRVAVWQTWPAGAVAATQDTLRRVVMRAIATGAMTLTWDESRQDEGPEGAYWQEQIPAWTFDSSGNVVGLSEGGIVFQASGPITSIVYTNGQITSYVESGVTYTLTYDGSGRVSTVIGGGLTRTVTYNGDGTVASYA